MKGKLFLTFLIMALAATSALATGINVYFYDDSIKDRDGRNLGANNYHNYKARLEFYHNANPTDPTNSNNRLDDNYVQTRYTLTAGEYKYQLADLDGGKLYVRIWKETPSGDRKGNYYGIMSHAVAKGSAPAEDWYITEIRASYKADVPYPPTVGSVSESLQRVGDNLKLKLVIPLSYDRNPASGDGVREAQSFSLKVTYPDGTTATKNGSTITLVNTPSGTYKFKPAAINWYGATEGPEVPYATLGGGGVAGPDSARYDFVKVKDGFGVNTFPLAYSDFQNPAITNIKELVEAINSQAGEPIVTAIGWWNAGAQKPEGYAIDIDFNKGEIKSYNGSAGLDPDPARVPFTRDMVVQVSVLKSAKFEVTGLR